MMPGFGRCFVARFVVACVLTANLPAWGADDEAQFPTDPAQWINSIPLSKAGLEGKTAVLWFFEETCPRCRAKWPEMISLAKSFEGKPIVFIAVNSGTPRSAIEQYARAVGLTWPIIVDPSREFEAACEIPEINLNNIYQLLLLTPGGRFESGNSANLQPVIEAALQGAKWRVDGAEIEKTLTPAWLSIEIGNYPAASAAIKKGLKSNKDEVKKSATLLNDYVLAQLKTHLEQHANTGKTDDWSKYKFSRQINEWFAGYEIPPDIASDAKRLASSPAVKTQLLAQRQFGQIQAALQSGNPQVMQSALLQMKTLIEKYPDTDAAQDAAKLAQKLSANLPAM